MTLPANNTKSVGTTEPPQTLVAQNKTAFVSMLAGDVQSRQNVTRNGSFTTKLSKPMNTIQAALLFPTIL